MGLKTKKDKLSPKYFFLRLMGVIVLIGSIWSFIAIAFSSIDILFPDPVRQLDAYAGSYRKDSIRNALSFFVVMFPVYVGIAASLMKIYRQKPKMRKMMTPKWFTYLSQFISGLIIIFSMVTLINRFFDGEITIAFVLKLLVILAVAGGIGAYHVWFVRKEEGK